MDFPYLTVKMAIEGDVKPILKYDVGIKYRWLFPDDVLHLLANLKSTSAFFRDFFDKNTKSNICLSDIKPNLFQFLTTFAIIISRIKNRNLKYPHKIPKVTS